MNVKLVPYDPNNPEQSLFLYKLWKEASSTLFDDRKKDPILLIQEISRSINEEAPQHFVVEINNEMAGFVGAIIDVYDIAYLDGVMKKEYRSFFPARSVLLAFAKHCFEHLGVAKIKAQIPVFNRNAETVSRSIGFRKEGISKKELIFNGSRVDILELALFPEYLKEKRK